MEKIKFESGSSSAFFKSLNKAVGEMMMAKDLLVKAKRTLWIKAAVYILLFTASISFLLFGDHTTFTGLLLNYILIGITGILMAFNISHDACHGSLSKNKKLNYWFYHLTFNIQGTSAYLWQIRHNSSHHVFPNVDGCDADIDNNPFLRLSPQHPLRKHQRYQHIYAIFVYCIYTLHWFLFKDALYLFKKNVANLQQKKHPAKEWVLFFFWKLVYVTLLILIPALLKYNLADVLLAFLLMHVCNSLFFIHVLIPTHFCMETQFPHTDEKGNLPGDYYTHQLVTSLDYAPSSKVCNWLLGGFNAHAAHHLYPKLPHTVYPEISVLIESKAKEFDIKYNKLGWWQGICSHYRFLKMMGRNPDINFNAKKEPEYIAQLRMSVISKL